jgi:hypothetical protein
MPAEIGTQAASAACGCEDFTPVNSLRKPAQARKGRLAVVESSAPAKRGIVFSPSSNRSIKIAEAIPICRPPAGGAVQAPQAGGPRTNPPVTDSNQPMP